MLFGQFYSGCHILSPIGIHILSRSSKDRFRLVKTAQLNIKFSFNIGQMLIMTNIVFIDIRGTCAQRRI